MSLEKKRKYVPIIVFFIFLTIIITYPLITNQSGILSYEDSLETAGNDNGFYLIAINHFVKFFKGEAAFFKIDELFYPFGPFKFGYSQGLVTLSHTVPAAMLTTIFGTNILQSHNTLILLYVFFSGLSMYFLCYELTKNKLSSILGGTVYISVNWILVKIIIGHPEMVQMQWLPLIFLFLERTISNPKTKNSLLLGLFVGLQAFTFEQITAYLTFFIPVYILIRKPLIITKIKFILNIALATLTSIVISGWYYLILIKSVTGIQSIEDNLFGSYNFLELLKWTMLGPIQNSLYIGIIPILFFIMGTIFALRLKNKKIIIFSIIGILAFIFMLGPRGLFSPYNLLYEFWPFINKFRTPKRMIMFLLLSISILSAYSFNIITKSIKNKTKQNKHKINMTFTIFIIILLLIIIPRATLLNKMNISLVSEREENKIYEYISEFKENITIIEFPNQADSVYCMNMFIHKKRIINALVSFRLKEHEEFLGLCGQKRLKLEIESCREKLKEFNTKFVIYNSNRYGSDWESIYEQIIKNNNSEFIMKSGNAYLFRIIY